MQKYFIESFKISKLWGYLDIDLNFNSDVNILIGPNGSGKTTILNLLHSILSADLRSVLDIGLEQAEVWLRNFQGESIVAVKVNTADQSIKFSVEDREHKIDMNTLSERSPDSYWPFLLLPEKSSIARRTQSEDSCDVLTTLVPIVWLPVIRRPPETDDMTFPHKGTDPVEPVDLRLQELLKDLSRYHSGLNTQLSERYSQFEHQVLSAILYGKEEDQLHSIRDMIAHSLPTEDEKQHLRKAFEAAGFLDEQMETKINDHFDAAAEVLKRIKENTRLQPQDILVLPLISRTKSMVEFASKLEEEREAIFAPLRHYEEIVNLFLNEKSVQVDESGRLVIESSSNADLDPLLLSSGEKQILILLTQALLRVDEPVVYMADEPELSLHVLWQEKLLESLVSLGGELQIIVATHSPDIVGRFRDKVIQLGRKS